MIERSSPSDSGFLTATDLALRWGKSVRTLQRWRAEHYGPAWLKIGATTFYRLDDVQRFERLQRICVEIDP